METRHSSLCIPSCVTAASLCFLWNVKFSLWNTILLSTTHHSIPASFYGFILLSTCHFPSCRRRSRIHTYCTSSYVHVKLNEIWNEKSCNLCLSERISLACIRNKKIRLLNCVELWVEDIREKFDGHDEIQVKKSQWKSNGPNGLKNSSFSFCDMWKFYGDEDWNGWQIERDSRWYRILDSLRLTSSIEFSTFPTIDDWYRFFKFIHSQKTEVTAEMLQL